MTEPLKEDGGAAGGAKKAALPPLLPKKFIIFVAVATFVLFITLVALSFAYPAMSRLQNAPKPSDSTRKMERLGVCLVYFAAKNNGALPAKLSELRAQGYAKDYAMFDSEELPGKVSSDEGIDAGTDFVYLASGGTLGDEPLPALRENSKEAQTLMVSKGGLSWKGPDTQEK